MRRIAYLPRLGTVFEPEVVFSMGKAYDRLRAQLGGEASDDEQIAAVIIAAASGGEHDPDRLCAATLTAFGTPRVADCRLQARGVALMEVGREV